MSGTAERHQVESNVMDPMAGGDGGAEVLVCVQTYAGQGAANKGFASCALVGARVVRQMTGLPGDLPRMQV